MAIADVDGDGLIDYNEFVAATMHLSKLEKEELLQQAFKQIDKDGSGTITVAVRGVGWGRRGAWGERARVYDSYGRWGGAGWGAAFGRSCNGC